MKILIIKLGALGDVVRTLPIVKAIKEAFPNSEISWATKENIADIVGITPGIDKILTIPFELDEEFDLLYNFDIEEEATELAMSVKAEKKYGFYSEGGYAASFNFAAEYYLGTLFDDEIKRSNKKSYQQMMFEIAELPYKKQHETIQLSEQDREYAENFMKEHNYSKEKLIGIHMGASSRWPSKVWARKRLKEFIISAKDKGYNIFLFGGPNEVEEHTRFAAELKEQGIEIFQNNPNNTNLEFTSLANLCYKMICSDSFSLQISLALKKPTIGLFFCTSPQEIESYGLLTNLIAPRMSEFFPEKMDKYDECLVESISAEQVLEAVEDNPLKVFNAIIIQRGKALLVRRAKSEIHSGKWAFPGGVMEKGETSGETLIREVKEETNLYVEEIGRKIGEYSYDRPSGEKTKGESYIVKVKGAISVGDDAVEFKWASPEEIENIDHVPGINEEFSLALSQ